MQHRSTASSFLLRQGRVLLLHRPVTMRSFPDRWSVVSGKLEAGESALQAARREIEEETRYTSRVLRLLTAGKPFEAVETGTDTCWRVHPFLWLLQDRSEPRLDVESDAFEWVRLGALAERPTVPRLADALESLRPALPSELTDGERFLREDREHGARELAEGMLRTLGQALPTLATWSQWVWGVMLLGSSRPAMAPLANLSLRLLENGGPPDPGEVEFPWVARLQARERVELAERLEEAGRDLAEAVEEAAEAAARSLTGHDRVATFSYSSNVLETFRRRARAAGPLPKVLLSPAHPTREGEAMGRRLAELGYEVAMVGDRDLPARVGEATLLLLGADAVFPDGGIANRAGSRHLAEAARAEGVAVEVVADAFKYQAFPEHFEAEFVRSPRDGEPLFERVDPTLLDRIHGLPPELR